MAVKIKLDSTNKIKRRLGINDGGKAELFLATESAKRMDKYIPYDTGTLKDSHDIEPGKVTYYQPYAKKQFYTNRGKGIRGKRWDLKMLSAEKGLLVRDLQNYIKRGAK